MAKVYFYYAAMNAGKSTVLLQSSYNYRERGMRTLLFTPAIDTRYGTGRIESRIGLRSGAISLATSGRLGMIMSALAGSYNATVEMIDASIVRCLGRGVRARCVTP